MQIKYKELQISIKHANANISHKDSELIRLNIQQYMMQYLLGFAAVFLLNGASNRINMTENKVQLDIVATLVRPEHNRVRCFVVELQIDDSHCIE